MIEATGLSRRFGTAEAVRDLSFQVEAGSVYGLLGKNGANWLGESVLFAEGPAVFVWPVALVALTAGLLVLQVWAVGSLEPWRQIRLAGGSGNKATSPGAVWRRPALGLVGPAPLGRGRGLCPAALYRAFARVRHNPWGTLKSSAGGLSFVAPLLLALSI